VEVEVEKVNQIRKNLEGSEKNEKGNASWKSIIIIVIIMDSQHRSFSDFKDKMKENLSVVKSFS